MASSPEKQELIGGKLKKVKLRKRELPTAEKAANVDLLVYDCIEQLQLRGLESEGILRVSGSIELVKKLQVIYSKGKRVYLDNVDIHTVAGLLKAYFRENSEVVCPDHLYPQLLACVEPGDENVRIDKLREFVQSLSVPQQELLHKTLVFLHKVAAKSKINKMDVNNLATMFAPIMFSPKTQAPEEILRDHQKLKDVTLLLITSYRKVFPGWSDTQVAKDQTQDLDDKIADWAGHRPGTKDFDKKIMLQEKKSQKLRACKEAEKATKIERTLSEWAGPSATRTILGERNRRGRRPQNSRSKTLRVFGGNRNKEERNSAESLDSSQYAGVSNDSRNSPQRKKRTKGSAILSRHFIKSMDAKDSSHKADEDGIRIGIEMIKDGFQQLARNRSCFTENHRSSLLEILRLYSYFTTSTTENPEAAQPSESQPLHRSLDSCSTGALPPEKSVTSTGCSRNASSPEAPALPDSAEQDDVNSIPRSESL